MLLPVVTQLGPWAGRAAHCCGPGAASRGGTDGCCCCNSSAGAFANSATKLPVRTCPTQLHGHMLAPACSCSCCQRIPTAFYSRLVEKGVILQQCGALRAGRQRGAAATCSVRWARMGAAWGLAKCGSCMDQRPCMDQRDISWTFSCHAELRRCALPQPVRPASPATALPKLLLCMFFNTWPVFFKTT